MANLAAGINLVPPPADKISTAPPPEIALEVPEVAGREDDVNIFVVSINTVRVMKEVAVILGLMGGEECSLSISTPLVTRDLGPKKLNNKLRFDDCVPFFACDKTDPAPMLNLDLKCNGEIVGTAQYDLMKCIGGAEKPVHEKLQIMSAEGIPAARVGVTAFFSPTITWQGIQELNEFFTAVMDEDMTGVMPA
eukprot:Platyproteum_vivax@DN3435_c0_g1_i1.p2